MAYRKNNKKRMASIKKQKMLIDAMRKAMADETIGSTPSASTMTDEEIKAASDARRAARAQQRIRIHQTTIEDLDETEKQEKANAIESKATGYVSRCRLISRPSRWNWLRMMVNWAMSWAMPKGEQLLPYKVVRKVELPRKLVEKRVVTRCASFFFDPNKEAMFLQFPELKMVNRTSIVHIERYKFSWLRRYAYYGIMDMTPEPSYVMYKSGIDPVTHETANYKLIEETGKDRYMGVGVVYRMQPQH